MAEKTSFSELVGKTSLDIAPGLKCCANCSHARGPITVPVTLKQVIHCKALPPGLISIPVRDPNTGAMSVQVHARWPELDPSEECDYFDPKNGSEEPQTDD